MVSEKLCHRKIPKSGKWFKKWCIGENFLNRKNTVKSLLSEKIFQVEKMVLNYYCRGKILKFEKWYRTIDIEEKLTTCKLVKEN